MRLRSLVLVALALLGLTALAWARTPIPTKLTINYHFDDSESQFVWSGKVKSDRGACFKDRKVILFNEDDPGDPLGNDRSDTDGKYEIRLDADGLSGDYFTKVRTLEKQGHACKAARSEKIPLS